MAFDAALLQSAIEGAIAPTLRFFDWSRPTVTIGYGQPRTDIDFAAISRGGLDFAVRPTGGRAVLHWDELTYSVTIPTGHAIAELSVLESYKLISLALAAGLKRLGLEIDLAKGEAGGHKNPSCFSSTSRFEIASAGRKLVGSAQRRKRGALLQQGSIPIGPQFRRLPEFFSAKNDLGELTDKSTCISECIENPPSRTEMIASIVAGFEEALGIRFEQQ